MLALLALLVLVTEPLAAAQGPARTRSEAGAGAGAQADRGARAAAAQRARRRAPEAERRVEPRRAVAPSFRKLSAQMPDGVTMTAEIYRVAQRSKRPRPVVVCLHEEASSRAEYRHIGPELHALGYHVLAVDLRSGGHGERVDPRTGARYGTPNETAASAARVHGRPMTLIDARADLPFVLAWTRRLFPESPVALLGSSFSASLALVYAAEHPDEVGAVLAFSPVERVEDVEVAEAIVELNVPTYVTCGKNDAETAAARALVEAAGQRVLTLLPAEEGLAGDHGSRVLLIPDARSRARQWALVERVLGHLRRGEYEE